MMFIWTVSDLIGLVVLGLLALIIIAMAFMDAIKQWRCKHFGFVQENHSCDAICRKCNKNLGFIGTWREIERQRYDEAG